MIREQIADAGEWLFQNRKAAGSEWLKNTTPTSLLNICQYAKKFDRVHAQPEDLTERVEEALVRLVAIEQNAANSVKWETLLQAVRGGK